MQEQLAERIRLSEILRYLGYRREQPDEAVLSLITECLRESGKVITPRSVYRRFPLIVRGEDDLDAGGVRLQSRSLAKNLCGCEEVLFFAATLGSGADRLMDRYGKLAVSKAAVLQAVLAATIEAYCDLCQEQLQEELAAEGKYLRPRFSPGYGDLSLTIQERFLQVLEASKRIGICLSDGGIMLPEKSVTAVMGVGRENPHCVTQGCEVCPKSDCIYRR